MKLKKILLITLAMVLAGGAGVVAKMSLATRRIKQPAFTLHSQVTHINPFDGSRDVEEQTTYAFSDGSYRIVQVSAQGMKEFFFKRGLGYFRADHKNKKLIKNNKISPDARNSPPPTAEQLRSSSQFLRTETVLGLTAYVHRIVNNATELPLSDVYTVVELGTMPIKVVDYDDGKASLIEEPLSVTLGEPDPSLLKLPNYITVEQ